MKISESGYYYGGGTTKLDYDEAPHAITGAEVKQYGCPENSDASEVVTAAINDISERQYCVMGLMLKLNL